MKSHHLNVYIAIRSFAGTNPKRPNFGRAFPRLSHLVDLTGLDLRWVRRCIVDLESLGLVTVERTNGKVNVIRFPDMEVRPRAYRPRVTQGLQTRGGGRTDPGTQGLQTRVLTEDRTEVSELKSDHTRVDITEVRQKMSDNLPITKDEAIALNLDNQMERLKARLMKGHD